MAKRHRLSIKGASVTALCALVTSTLVAVPATAAPDFDYSDYTTPTSGTPGYIDVPLNQQGVKDEALAEIRKWRQDALDTDVPWRANGTRNLFPAPHDGAKFWWEDDPNNPRMTMREYLQMKGISEQEYLNPQWSDVLERYALQRAIDNYANDGPLTHETPNAVSTGTRTPTPSSFHGSVYENLSWGDNATKSIELYAEEKACFITIGCKDVVGHYAALIEPEIVSYGVAGFATQPEPAAWPYFPGKWALIGEPTYWAQSPHTDGITAELSGTQTAKVYLDETRLPGADIDQQTLLAGQTITPTVTNQAYDSQMFKFPAGRFTLRGDWTSENPNIVTVVGDQLQGVANGTTHVVLTTENGRTFRFEMNVIAIASVNTPAPVTVPAGVKPALPPQVEVVYSDGTVALVDVTWESFADALWQNPAGGEFTVHGAIAGFPSGVDITVKVQPATVSKVVFTGTEQTSTAVTTESGTAPTLPTTASITWSNGDVTEETITWPADQTYKNREGGTYTLTTTVQGQQLTATVTVNPATVSKVVFTGTEQTSTAVTTESGTAPTLPTTASITWSNGDVTEETITWPADQTYKNREGGTYTLTTTVQGQQLTATVTVNPATVSKVEAPAPIETKVAVQPSMPATLPVTWSNGEVTQEPVTWQSVDVSAPGTFTVSGTVAGQPVTITVVVVDKQIVSIDPVAPVTTESGTPPTLPATVHVKYDNGTEGDYGVTWSNSDAYKNREGGTYQLVGTVTGWSGEKPTITVTVNPAVAKSAVFAGTSEATTSITTPSGTAPALPANAEVTWSNGDTTTEPITWPADDSYNKREGGTYTLTGEAAGQNLTANITVTPATPTSATSPAAVHTPLTVQPTLPATVEVVWSNGDATAEAVVWDVIPADQLAAPGTIVVNGKAMGQDVTIDVIVDPATAKLSPAQLSPGEALTIDGSGFLPNEEVSFYLDQRLLGRANANAAGDVTLTVTIGKDVAVGTYQVHLVQGAISAAADLEVVAAQKPAPEPGDPDPQPSLPPPGTQQPTPEPPSDGTTPPPASGGLKPLPSTGAATVGGALLAALAMLGLGGAALASRRYFTMTS